MSAGVTVSAHEHGVVRVVTLDYALSMEIGHMGTLDGLAKALGVETLNHEDVQIVQIDTIRDMGLSWFLGVGYDIPEDELAQVTEELDALEGQVAVIRSGAFGGKAATLKTDGAARLVATLNEARPPVEFEPLPTGGAEGAPIPVKKTPSDAAMSGRVAMLALLVIFALTGLMVWIAA